MAHMFAFADSRGGELRKVALEMVAAEVHALLIGAPGIASKAPLLAKVGADVVIVVEHAGLERYSPEVFAATAAAVLKAKGCRAAFFGASAQGKDLAPRVAATLGVSLASDLTTFAIEGDAQDIGGDAEQRRGGVRCGGLHARGRCRRQGGVRYGRHAPG